MLDDGNVEGLIGDAVAIARAVRGSGQEEQEASCDVEPGLPQPYQRPPSSALGPYVDGTGTSSKRR